VAASSSPSPRITSLRSAATLKDPDGYLIELGQGTGILHEVGRR
jgi:hypothetical protein